MSNTLRKYRRQVERLKTDGETLWFDYAAVPLHILSETRRSFFDEMEKEDVPRDRLVPRAVRQLMGTLVTASYPLDPRTGTGGMKRKDAQVWAAWLESMEDKGPTRVEATRGQIEWLLKHAENDELALQTGMAQWREALVDYVKSLLEARDKTPTSSGQVDGAGVG